MQPASLAGTTLERYLHVCGFFSSRDEQYEVLGPFYREGLDAGEKVLAIIDPSTRSEHGTLLQRCGVEDSRYQAAGQLEVLSWNEAYLEDGVFDQGRMLTTVESILAAGRTKGYPRCRITGQMGWAVQGHPGSEQLLEYEVRVNEVLARTRQPAVCIYDRALLTGPLMMDILRSHPLTLVGGVVQENPFYTPPDLFLRELRARRAASLQLQ